MPDMIFPDALYLSIEQSDKRGLVLYTGELMREFGAGVLVCEGIRLLGMVGTHRGQLQGKWGMTGKTGWTHVLSQNVQVATEPDPLGETVYVAPMFVKEAEFCPKGPNELGWKFKKQQHQRTNIMHADEKSQNAATTQQRNSSLTPLYLHV